ncbi:MAG TPA: SsgA family sporulation/cell division regulator [Candidatus Saccharimonadales bacterium]|nr:SsgA family sporulation/cell division regulator [Candidatus Saccharimonadales bacterium]
MEPNKPRPDLEPRVSLSMTGYLEKKAGMDPLEAIWSYDPTDPYTVSVTMRDTTSSTPGRQVAWSFGRELLTSALTENEAIEETPIGDGDVQFRPCSPGDKYITMVLNSDGEQASIVLPRADLKRFLGQSYTLVLPGEESKFLEPGLDETIDQLLWGSD